ncbi:glycosyltransferase [Chryseobacterium sp. cx-311]|uniref:glycosyltransferase n=1 Tax=Marnyiella aurantia TaxID=2758037 RepID=UPI001AE956CC|nr:glycosyltransferase [Marnyiella aurantia]MBP0612945.1 glycosyltransferase [Marnyiella aurantia]
MKRKIVFVIESLHLGGAEKSLVTLLQNLDAAVYDVELLTIVEGGFFKDKVPAWVRWEVIPSAPITVYQRITYFLQKKLSRNKHHAQILWPIIAMNYTRRTKKYDVAIAYGQGFPTYFVNQKLIANKKYSWLNTDYTKAGYQIQSDYSVYPNFNKIIAVSDEAKESFLEVLSHIGKTLEVEVIKDISDTIWILEQANSQLKFRFDSKKINIVSVGRLAASKSFGLAIEACKLLKEKNIPIAWYIVGEGSERNFLQSKIDRLNLSTDMHLLGADTNPYPYMKACDIYVQTSLFEGLGLTVIEASILQKPIVCTNFPTAYGILKDGETGLIAEMTAESISENIERLIVNVNLRNQLVKNLSLQENYDKEKSLQQINDLLN